MKIPQGVATSPGAFRLVGLAVLVESVKPLADVMRHYICYDRLQNREDMNHQVHLPSQVRWAG